MAVKFDFTYVLQYFLCPMAGAVCAYLFYEFVFVKTQEYLADDDETSMEDKNDLSPGPMRQSTIVSEKIGAKSDSSEDEN